MISLRSSEALYDYTILFWLIAFYATFIGRARPVWLKARHGTLQYEKYTVWHGHGKITARQEHQVMGS